MIVATEMALHDELFVASLMLQLGASFEFWMLVDSPYVSSPVSLSDFSRNEIKIHLYL